MRRGLRFRAPAVTAPADAWWVLRRALGPVGPATPSPELDSQRVVKLAGALGLAPRLGARVPSATLAAEAGEGAAAALQRARRGAVAGVLALESLLAEVAAAARGLGAPLVVLKGMALHLDGVLREGSRTVADLDVLVERAVAEGLQAALEAAGCTAEEGFRPGEQHLLPLRSPASGAVVEVHHALRGVRLAGRRSAAAGEVLEQRGCSTLADLPGCFLPGRDVLVAHLLVHGIAQHGMAREYPLTRLLADLVDLGLDEAGLATFLAGPFAWIAAEVSRDEVSAAIRLAARLARGDDPAVLAGTGTPEAVLLRHALAVVLDDGYLRSLRLERRLAMPAVESRGRSVLRTLAGSLLLTRRQVDMLYGGPRSPLGYLALRLWRPFDVLGRLAVYGWSWLRRRATSGRDPRRRGG